MRLDTTLNSYIIILAVIFLVLLLLWIITTYLQLNKFMKTTLSSLIIILAALWILEKLGKLDELIIIARGFLGI